MVMNANPFADLIPTQSQGSNPFADLIPNNKMSPFMSAVTGFNTGVERTTTGVMQGINDLVRYASNDKVGNDFKKGLDRTAQAREADFQNAVNAHPNYAEGGAITGGVGASIPAMAIPGFGEGAVTRAVTSGLAQGGLMGASQYVNPNESRLLNTIVGGATGGIVSGALSGLGKLGTKAYNAAKGNFSSPEEATLYNLGKQYNVPTMAGDISSSEPIQAVNKALDYAPVLGTRNLRATQMDAAKVAAQGVTNDAEANMINTQYGGLTGLKKIQEVAQSNNPARAQAAQNLLEEVKNSGDDWNKIIQTSGNVRLFRAKLIADAKYNKVSQLADQYGPVDTRNIVKTVNNMIGNEAKGVIKNEGLLNTLNKIKQGLFEQQPAQAGSSLVDTTGQQIIPNQESQLIPRQLNYTQLRQFRSDLGDEISDYFTGKNAAIGAKGVGALQAVKNQIDTSLNRFSQINGEGLKTAWRNADNFYSTYVTPAKDRLLANALKNANPDEVYGKFITRGYRVDGKGSGRALDFYNALDEKGRSAVRYGLISDAFHNAYKPETNLFSPGQFANSLDQKAVGSNIFFKGQDKDTLEGFKNLMRHVERSYQALNLPETGVRYIPASVVGIMGAGSFFRPGLTALTAGFSYGLKKLFTTDAGKRFLLSSSKLRAGTPAMNNALQTLKNIFSQGAASTAVQPYPNNSQVGDQ